MLVVGYSSYKRANLRLDRKLNMAWSRYFNDLDRLRLQSNLHCCGFYTPLHQATFSRNCYPRTILPGCKGKLYRYEGLALRRLYITTFTTVFVVLGCIVTSLLASNHVNETFGKGLTPRKYRLDMTHVRRNALGIMRTLAENSEIRQKQDEEDRKRREELERFQKMERERTEREKEQFRIEENGRKRQFENHQDDEEDLNEISKSSFQEIELGEINPDNHNPSHQVNNKRFSAAVPTTSNPRSSLYLRPAQAVNILAKHLDPRQYSLFSPFTGGSSPKPYIPPKSPNRMDRKDWNVERKKKATVEDADEDDEDDRFGTIRIIDTSKGNRPREENRDQNGTLTGLGLSMKMNQNDAWKVNGMRQD